MDTTVADPLLGALLDGRYRVRARVARGGMATVYTATDERLERTVALKIIHPGQSDDHLFVERFTDEAKTIARLTHPNVVAVYDQGSHHGVPYLVMEFVRGQTLRDVLAERRRLQPQEALAIMEQMLSAISAAHRAGLVHRDVKPENVLVAEAPGAGHNLIDGVVKVADFGLARAVEASADSAEAGHLMATVAYVAPELVTEGYADPRTDVYSAGIVLFEMLTGRVPYSADRPVEVAWQHVDRDVPPPSEYVPGLPEVLDELVTRATRRDPGDRPTDAGAMLAEVQAARDEIGIHQATRSRPLVQPTVVVPRVESVPQNYQTGQVHTGGQYRGAPSRPSWSRLPSSRPGPDSARRRPLPGAGRLASPRDLLARLNAHPQGRLGLAAALLTLGLLVAIGGYWFGVGRYTSAPGLLTLDRAAAEARADTEGFTVQYAEGRFSETVAVDKVIEQQPAPGARIVNGGIIVITLSLGPERFKIPDVAGKSFDLAQEDFKSLRLTFTRAEVFDDSIPKDSVVRTEPPIGTEVKPGQAVQVFVSKGSSPLKVPNVIGKNVDEATSILRGKKLVIKVVAEVDSDLPKGQVTEQNPADGTGVEQNSTVEVKVSKGPPAFAMPEVRNKPVDDAKRELEALGLRVEVVGFGTVRFQSPDAGTQVQAGQNVRLFAGF